MLIFYEFCFLSGRNIMGLEKYEWYIFINIFLADEMKWQIFKVIIVFMLCC